MFRKPITSKDVNAGSNMSEPGTPAAESMANAGQRFSVRSTRPLQRDRVQSYNGHISTPRTSSLTRQSFSLSTLRSSHFPGANSSQLASSTGKPSKVRHSSFVGKTTIAEMERQIRRLVSERSTMLKSADSKDAELNKAGSRLQVCLQAKTQLQSTLARIEKEVKDLRKSNAILNTKVNTLETTGLKKKDIQVELAHARGAVVSKEHDLADAKAQVQELQLKLEKRTKAFKEQEEELKKLKSRLSSDIRSLRSELSSSQAQLSELASNASEASYDRDNMEHLEMTISSLLALIGEVNNLAGNDQTSSRLDELKSQISVVLKEFSHMHSTLISSEDRVAQLQLDCEDKDLTIEFLQLKLGELAFSECGSASTAEHGLPSQDPSDEPQLLTKQWVDNHAKNDDMQSSAGEQATQSVNLEGAADQQNEELEKLRLSEKQHTEIVSQLELRVQSLESDCDYYHQAGATSSQELQKVISDCDEKALMIASLLQKLEQYQGECDDTTEAAQNLEDYIRNIQAEKEMISARTDELQHQVEDGRVLVAEQEALIDELKQKIEQMLNENTDKHAYIEDLEDKVKLLNEKEQSLREELCSNVETLANTVEKVDGLEAECATKTGLIAALEEELRESREETQNSYDNTAQLTEKVSDLAKENLSSAANIQQMTEELQKFHQDYDDEKRRNELLHKELEKSKEELEMSAALVVGLKNDIATLKNDAVSTCNLLLEKDEELRMMKATSENQAMHILQLCESIKTLKESGEVKDEAITNLENQVAYLQDAHSEHCIMIEEKERELSQVKCDFTNQTIVVQETRSLIDKLADELKAKSSEVGMLQENLEDLRREYNEKLCLLKECYDHTETLQSECAAKTTVVSNLEKQVNELDSKSKALLESNRHLEQCLSEAEVQIADKTAIVDDVLTKLTTTTDALNSQYAALEQLQVEHEERVTMIRDCESRLETMKNQYECAKTVLENVRQHLADVQNDLNHQLRQQKAELQQKIITIEELQSSYDSVQLERDDLASKLADMEEIVRNEQIQHATEMNITRHEILSKDAAIDELKTQMVDCQNDLNQQLTNQAAELQQTSAELEEIRSEYNTLLLDRDHLTNSVLEKDTLLQEKLVEHVAIVESMNVAVEKLKEENVAKALEIEQLKELCDHAQNNFHQQLMNYKTEMQLEMAASKELRLKCDLLQEERDNLDIKCTEQNRTLNEMMATHEAALQHVNSTLDSLKEESLTKDCTIQELQLNLSGLQQELTQQLTGKANELERTVIELEEVQAKCKDFQLAKLGLENQLCEINETIQKADIEHASSMIIIDGLKDENVAKMSIIENLQQQVVDVQKILATNEQELKQNEDELGTTKDQLSCVQKQLSEKDEILSATYSKLRDLEDEMLDKHSVMEKTAANNLKLEETLSQKCNEVNHLHSVISALKAELENGSHRNEELVSQMETFRHALEDKDRQLLATEMNLNLLKEQREEETRQLVEQLKAKDELFAEKCNEEAVFRQNIHELQLKFDKESQRLQALMKVHKEIEQRLMEKEDSGQQERLALQAELDKLIECSQEMQAQNKKLNRENKEISYHMRQVESDLNRYKAQAEWYVNRERDFAHELSILEERAKGSQAELLRWKSFYEDLRRKVEPFQEQLDMFQAEKQALLSQNSETVGEMHKLSQQYALLLGHQNQKQKIHHVLKLKEENLETKRENAKLKEEILKLQQKLRRLDEQLTASTSRKKFDPSKAFVHDKENTPVKDVSNSFRR